MGGDTVSVPSSTIDYDDDPFTMKPEVPALWLGGLIEESDAGGSFRDYYYKALEVESNDKRITTSVYKQVIKSYDDLKDRVDDIDVAKSKVLSYTPGSWVGNEGGMSTSDYNVPKTTTLLLIGPKQSGKSTLVNRITRVFEDDKFAPERAQVTYNSSIRDGTCFLQEYTVPRNSTSFCLYDTRGFSNDLSENLEMIEQWITKGVRHGELVKSASDSSSFRARMKCKNHQDELLTNERRRVDFVIFVVNGLSALKCMENSRADTEYMNIVTEVFNSPFLSFKDHKPVIAITHGDLLSISERARVRVFLGNLLGVHPSKQTFDIPDNYELITELTIVDLVRYSLEHADRNLPRKSRPGISKGCTIQLWTPLLLLLAVFIFGVHLHGLHSLKLHPESVPEPVPEIKKVIEVDRENVPKPDLEITKVTEFNPGTVPERILEMNEVIAGSTPKPSKKSKIVDAETTPRKKQKMKKVRVSEPSMKIDWKTIRHLWYAEPSVVK